MVQLHQPPESPLDRLRSGSRIQTELSQCHGTGITPHRLVNAIRAAAVTSGATSPAGSRMGMGPQPLAQISHHTAGIFIQPFTGSHPIESECRQHSCNFFVSPRSDGSHQVMPQARGQPIQSLLQRQLCRKAVAVELIDQGIQRALPQHTPTGLPRQGGSPGLDLSWMNPPGCLC